MGVVSSFENGAVAQFDLSPVVHIKHFHVDLIPFAERGIMDVLQPLLRDFRNMAKPFLAENLNKVAKRHDRCDLSVVDFADFHFCRKIVDDLLGSLHGLGRYLRQC